LELLLLLPDPPARRKRIMTIVRHGGQLVAILGHSLSAVGKACTAVCRACCYCCCCCHAETRGCEAAPTVLSSLFQAATQHSSDIDGCRARAAEHNLHMSLNLHLCMLCCWILSRKSRCMGTSMILLFITHHNEVSWSATGRLQGEATGCCSTCFVLDTRTYCNIQVICSIKLLVMSG
jgi:hypothetical protein